MKFLKISVIRFFQFFVIVFLFKCLFFELAYLIYGREIGVVEEGITTTYNYSGVLMYGIFNFTLLISILSISVFLSVKQRSWSYFIVGVLILLFLFTSMSGDLTFYLSQWIFSLESKTYVTILFLGTIIVISFLLMKRKFIIHLVQRNLKNDK